MDLGEIGRSTAIKSLMPVQHGVPMVLALTPDVSQAGIVRVYAMIALYRRGLPLLSATAAVDEIVARGRTAVLLPMVEDDKALMRDLDEAGCAAALDDVHANAAMLARIRAAMNLPPDLPLVIPAEGATLQ